MSFKSSLFREEVDGGMDVAGLARGMAGTGRWVKRIHFTLLSTFVYVQRPP